MVSKAIPLGPASPSRAGSLTLVAGALALDFANTASGRRSLSATEHLREPEHLVAWAEHAWLIEPLTAEAMRARLAEHGFARLLPDALELREAIHGIVAAIAGGDEPPSQDLVHLKQACAKAIAAAELVPGPAGFAWSWPQDPPIPDIVLGPIALSAVGLLREADPKRLKQCAGDQCGWLFLDTTKNRSRRWCEMSVCGNRAKARRFVARAADDAPGPTADPRRAGAERRGG